MSYLEDEFYLQLKCYDIEQPKKEYKFHSKRKWRADFAWPDQKLLVEIEGGIYSQGRHVRGKGFENDCEKYNEAQLLGYTIIRVCKSHIKNLRGIKWIQQFLKMT